MSSDHPTFDSTVMVLAEQAARHMKKEEDEIFPRLRHSRLDLVGTGERMAARKTQLGDGTYRPQAHPPGPEGHGRPALTGPGGQGNRCRPVPLSCHSGQGDARVRRRSIPDNTMTSNTPTASAPVGAGARRSRPAGRDGRHLQRGAARRGRLRRRPRERPGLPRHPRGLAREASGTGRGSRSAIRRPRRSPSRSSTRCWLAPIRWRPAWSIPWSRSMPSSSPPWCAASCGLKEWQGTERIVVGGGFSASHIGELAMGRAAVLLAGEGVDDRAAHRSPTIPTRPA